MLPTIHILGRTIPMYGLMAGLGLGLAVLYMEIAARRHREIRGDAEISLALGIIGAFIGAKILYVITVFPQFRADLPILFSDPMRFLATYIPGGFVFYGGFFGAILAVLIYSRAAHVKLSELLQLMMPMLPLIHAFGRVGCFMVGCCYGCPAVGSQWGIAFTASEIAPNGIPLVPVQLYEAAAEIVIFAVLALFASRGVSGIILLWIYTFTYGVVRFVLETFRGDEARGFVGRLSTSRFVAIICMVIGVVALIIKRKELVSALSRRNM